MEEIETSLLGCNDASSGIHPFSWFIVYFLNLVGTRNFWNDVIAFVRGGPPIGPTVMDRNKKEKEGKKRRR